MDALADSIVSCATGVHPTTMSQVVRVESSGHAFAIGVVGGRLQWQPRSLGEALATIRDLRARGKDFSVGVAQINQRNFYRLGLTDRTALDPCANLRAGAQILRECYARATRTPKEPPMPLAMALSCYYSGNFQTGFEHGYVQKVMGRPRAVPGFSSSNKELK